jgi:predicted nucleic acid-binding protein
MQYVGTSLLVAALLNEKGTAVAQRWLGDQPAGELAVSDWVITEFSAALSMKLRTGELEPPQRSEVLAFFTRLTETSFHVLPVLRLDFQTAARFADQVVVVTGAARGIGLAIAEAFAAGVIDPHALEAMDPTEVSAALTALKGIGPWTAEMFLIFGMGHPDIWSPGDLGLRKAVEAHFGTEQTSTEVAKRWAPYRSYAALYLWEYVDKGANPTV